MYGLYSVRARNKSLSFFTIKFKKKMVSIKVQDTGTNLPTFQTVTSSHSFENPMHHLPGLFHANASNLTLPCNMSPSAKKVVVGWLCTHVEGIFIDLLHEAFHLKA